MYFASDDMLFYNSSKENNLLSDVLGFVFDDLVCFEVIKLQFLNWLEIKMSVWSFPHEESLIKLGSLALIK